MKDIRAYWGSSHEYGGCNACNRYVVNAHSPRKHQVLVIDFLRRALSFRLCSECVEALKHELNNKPLDLGCTHLDNEEQTTMTTQQYTESQILDYITDAVSRFKREGERGIDWTLMHMPSDARLAFDLFLVRTKDPLAYEAGTMEYRFKTRVKRMAELVAPRD